MNFSLKMYNLENFQKNVEFTIEKALYKKKKSHYDTYRSTRTNQSLLYFLQIFEIITEYSALRHANFLAFLQKVIIVNFEVFD